MTFRKLIKQHYPFEIIPPSWDNAPDAEATSEQLRHWHAIESAFNAAAKAQREEAPEQPYEKYIFDLVEASTGAENDTILRVDSMSVPSQFPSVL